MFQDYQQQFAEELEAASAKLAAAADATSELRAAGAALKAMTMEARKLPPAERKQGKKDCGVAKKQLEKLERTALLGAGGGSRVNDSASTADHKAQMMKAMPLQAEHSETAGRKPDTPGDTADGEDTMEELERNRTTIKRNIDRAKHANAQMTTAESITYKMKHWWRNL